MCFTDLRSTVFTIPRVSHHSSEPITTNRINISVLLHLSLFLVCRSWGVFFKQCSRDSHLLILMSLKNLKAAFFNPSRIGFKLVWINSPLTISFHRGCWGEAEILNWRISTLNVTRWPCCSLFLITKTYMNATALFVCSSFFNGNWMLFLFAFYVHEQQQDAAHDQLSCLTG